MKKGKTLGILFLTMLKIGLFTFGGGYAMIALLQAEFVDRKKWLKQEEFYDMIAVSESTPGPIAINSATYVGYKAAKFWGAACATVAVCIPSFVIIFLISLFFDAFLSFRYVQYAFRGIQACVAYLILSAGLKMIKNLKKNAFNISVLIGVTAAMVLCTFFAVDFSSVFYILIGGALGLSVYAAKRAFGKNRKTAAAEEKSMNGTTADETTVNNGTTADEAAVNNSDFADKAAANNGEFVNETAVNNGSITNDAAVNAPSRAEVENQNGEPRKKEKSQ